ncbi:hypothetical protein B0H16DRAFT_1688601 [Mycena metata]|uniref:Uncharacterized protein n=1 Tax=Mycena metata TaxID=1033252 RepID=A0AAD7NG76_9AGAR|nr:hypothetical protein B0H16DRAFT_1688601 [Mycena metata]
MAHFLSRLWFPVLDALWCLVRMLFGRFSGPVVDPEGGTLTPVVTLKDDVVEQVPVPTFVPDFDSVPALILSSMVIGAAVSPKIADRVPAIIVAGGPPVPRIVLTPPEDEPKPAQIVGIPISEPVGEKQERKPQCGRTPLSSISNIAPRVHGKLASKARSKQQKENVREHPNAPRVVKPSPLVSRLSKNVQVVRTSKTIKRAEFVKAIETLKRMHTEPDKAVEPGSSAWEQDKRTHLAQARAFSEDVKACRRRSLPTPSPASPVNPKPLRRSASAPGRLSLEERLYRAVADTKPVVRAPPLWGDDHVSFVVEEEDEAEDQGAFDGPPEAQSTLPISASYNSVSSGGSLSSILNAFEDGFKSPVWLERQRFSDADVESARGSGSSRDSTWSDVFSLQDYA